MILLLPNEEVYDDEFQTEPILGEQPPTYVFNSITRVVKRDDSLFRVLVVVTLIFIFYAMLGLSLRLSYLERSC